MPTHRGQFEWDAAKNAANVAKHRLAFADAAECFRHPMLVAEDSRVDYGERRMVGVGTMDGVVIVVVFTERDGKIRIISARKANRYEREKFADFLRKGGV